MTNSSERKALRAILAEAIIKSKEEDDGDPLFHEVRADSVNPFPNKVVQDAIFTSLSLKGLILCSGAPGDPEAAEMVDWVCLTQEGIDAATAADSET